jgi:hypothetical protein
MLSRVFTLDWTFSIIIYKSGSHYHEAYNYHESQRLKGPDAL